MSLSEPPLSSSAQPGYNHPLKDKAPSAMLSPCLYSGCSSGPKPGLSIAEPQSSVSVLNAKSTHHASVKSPGRKPWTKPKAWKGTVRMHPRNHLVRVLSTLQMAGTLLSNKILSETHTRACLACYICVHICTYICVYAYIIENYRNTHVHMHFALTCFLASAVSLDEAVLQHSPLQSDF